MNSFDMPGEKFFKDWTVSEKIGEGAYGSVYKIERNLFDEKYYSALKIIRIPSSSTEVESLVSEGYSEEDIEKYFEDIVRNITKEIALMAKLKGHTNIVSYEDHMVVKNKEETRWDILIRMEYLIPIRKYLSENSLTYRDVIKLGIDICTALELCQKYNIIHRDIKPENIFISESGDYKLGDFGIARTTEETLGILSKKGTCPYMAPEVYRGEPYGASVDIYSLGLVMYLLLNNNRMPFIPSDNAFISFDVKERALAKRISGVPFPPPKNNYERLTEIILKACAFNISERYSSASQMKNDLITLLDQDFYGGTQYVEDGGFVYNTNRSEKSGVRSNSYSAGLFSNAGSNQDSKNSSGGFLYEGNENDESNQEHVEESKPHKEKIDLLLLLKKKQSRIYIAASVFLILIIGFSVWGIKRHNKVPDEPTEIVVEDVNCDHKYENPTWQWTENTSAKAFFKCSVCNQIISKDAVIVEEVETPATETEDGMMTYVAKVAMVYVVYKDKIQAEIPKIKNVKLTETSFEYDGTKKTPNVKVTDEKGKKLSKGKDFIVDYGSSCIKAGKYTAKITFIGKYKGEKSLDFEITSSHTTVTHSSQYSGYTSNSTTKGPNFWDVQWN